MGQIPRNERSIEPAREDLAAVESQNPESLQFVAYPLNEILQEIQKAARDAGFEAPLFSVISGYRSIAEQRRLYEEGLRKHGPDKVSDFVARPGNSAHHTGFAFDINLGLPAKSENVNAIRRGQPYAFMRQIAQNYGLWELPTEPWHWELDKEARDAYIASKSFADKTPDFQDDSSGGDIAQYGDRDVTVLSSQNSKSSNTKKVLVFGGLLVASTVLIVAANAYMNSRERG